jgi:hypothetical protein
MSGGTTWLVHFSNRLCLGAVRVPGLGAGRDVHVDEHNVIRVRVRAFDEREARALAHTLLEQHFVDQQERGER